MNLFVLQMNANNQMSTNLKTIKLQNPISALNYFAISINELKQMYPALEEKKDESG